MLSIMAQQPQPQPQPQPQRSKVQDVSKSRDTRVERLVVDTNALIKRVRLDEVAQQLYTVPSVLVRPTSFRVAVGEISLDRTRSAFPSR